MPHYYTVDEVNAFVPELTRIFTRVLQLRAQLRALYRRLEDKGFAPASDDIDPAPPGAPPEVVRDRTMFQALVDTLKGELFAVQAMGCEIKDLELGLVDWLGKNGARDVYLCWRFGETEVGWFHDLDAGFRGRRPISELEPPPRTLH